LGEGSGGSADTVIDPPTNGTNAEVSTSKPRGGKPGWMRLAKGGLVGTNRMGKRVLKCRPASQGDLHSSYEIKGKGGPGSGRLGCILTKIEANRTIEEAILEKPWLRVNKDLK